MSRAASGATWQSASSDPSDLKKREQAKIRAHWDEFVRYTTPPGIPFGWGEWPLRPDLKHYALHHGFIEESDAGSWETKEKLWMFLLKHAADDEEIGTRAVGQVQLPVDAGESARESRVLGDTPPRTRNTGTGRQQTLTGSDADEIVKTGESVETNWLKARSIPSKHARAAADNAQASLHAAAVDAPGCCRSQESQATLGAFTGVWIGLASHSAPTVEAPVGESYRCNCGAVTVTPEH